MNLIRFLGSFFLLAALSGCMTITELVPVDDGNTNIEVFLYRDKEVAFSKMQDSLVTGYAYKKDKYLVLHLAIQNRGQEYVNIWPEKVRVEVVSGEGAIQELRVYSAREYINKTLLPREIFIGLMEAGVDVTMVANEVIPDSERDESDDSQAEVHAELETLASEYQRLGDETQDTKTALEETLLMKTSLFPGHHIEGDIYVDAGKGELYRVHIPVGSEMHVIDFEPL